MKRTKRLLVTAVIAATVLAVSACAGKTGTTERNETASTSEQVVTTSQAEENKSADADGIWAGATYLEDTELGEGTKTFTVEVKADEKTVTFTIHTDEKTVGAALIENGLIAGEDGEFGLYIKSVNGITADYNADQTYWAFYINGEYATSGVDTTDITEGAEYRLERTR